MAGLFFLFLLPFCLGGKEVFCEICHTSIKGRYFLINRKPCCSRNCVEEMRRRLLPACALCRRSVERFVKRTSVAGEQVFCTSCNVLPGCFHCKFPAGGGLETLPDSRRICRECRRGAVKDPRRGEELFRKVRSDLKRLLGIGTGHRITFSLADSRKIASLNNRSSHREWGLFVCKKAARTKIVRSRLTGKVLQKTSLPVQKEYFIYILSHLPAGSFAQTAVHELTHDYMEEYFPCIKDPVWCEGAAEYAASLYNIVRKNSGRNQVMEKNDDPVYGEGYRMFRRLIPSSLSPREKAEKLKLLLARKNREEQKRRR